jgi:hypothetical protein
MAKKGDGLLSRATGGLKDCWVAKLGGWVLTW